MPEPAPIPPRVFISYSHDSPEHAARVLALADRLRADGIDAMIDQYEPNPKEGWARWMDKQLAAAQFVLLICTETYHRRIQQQEEAGVGLGVQFEGHLIFGSLMGDSAQGSRYIPILLGDNDQAYIPRPITDHTRYRLTGFALSEPPYRALYRHLTGQQATPMQPVGPLVTLPPQERNEAFPGNVLGGFGTPPAPAEAAPVEDKDVDLLLCCCDRITPTGTFTTAYRAVQDLQPAEARSRPHIYFIGGIDEDEHRDFVKRLVEVELSKLPDLLGEDDRGEDDEAPALGAVPPLLETKLPGKIRWPVEIRWPVGEICGGMALPSLENMLKEDILRPFVPAEALKPLEKDPTRLRAEANRGIVPWVKDQPLVVVSLMIPSTAWSGNGPALLRSFLQYWAAQRSHETLFLALVSLVVYPPVGRGLAGLREKLVADSMRRWPKDQARRGANFLCGEIPDLGPVARHEAQGWMDENDVLEERDERAEEIKRIYGEKTTLRMRPLRRELHDLWKKDQARKRGRTQ